MNNLPGAIVASIGVTLSLAAFFAVLGVFFPYRLGRIEAALDSMPGRAFIVGLVNLLFFGAVVLVLFSIADRLNSGGLRLIAVIGLSVLSIGLSFGLTAVARFVGGRVRSQASDLAQTTWGAALLVLACALPFIGWFGLLPFVAAIGLGSFILSFFSRPASL